MSYQTKIHYSNYMLAGISSSIVTIFTNPLEVVKTRLQLQGELQLNGKQVKLYRGVIHGFYQIGRYDGIRALQKGLSSSIPYQFIFSAVRFGIFDMVSAFGWTQNPDGSISIWRGFLYGGLSGTLGSCLANPFFLVKIQMQSYSNEKVAVGFQHKHASVMSAFKKIYAAHGIRGLYRGVTGNIPRGILGSGSQLAMFEPLRHHLNGNDLNRLHPYLNTFLCSTIAGSAMAVAVTPSDIILARLYNQPLDENGKGKYYSGVYDCVMKMIKIEGLSSLYKGFWPSYLRMAPQSTLTLILYDESKMLRDKYFPV